MKEITAYQTTDGSIFGDKLAAEKHESASEIDRLLALASKDGVAISREALEWLINTPSDVEKVEASPVVEVPDNQPQPSSPPPPLEVIAPAQPAVATSIAQMSPEEASAARPDYNPDTPPPMPPPPAPVTPGNAPPMPPPPAPVGSSGYTPNPNAIATAPSNAPPSNAPPSNATPEVTFKSPTPPPVVSPLDLLPPKLPN